MHAPTYPLSHMPPPPPPSQAVAVLQCMQRLASSHDMAGRRIGAWRGEGAVACVRGRIVCTCRCLPTYARFHAHLPSTPLNPFSH